MHAYLKVLSDLENGRVKRGILLGWFVLPTERLLSGGNEMESVTVGGLTFCWTDNVLMITTPTGQHLLNRQAAANLLVFLDANRDEIFTVDQAGEVSEWAQPQEPDRSVIGNITQQERRLPAASTDRRRRSRRGRGKV